MNKKEREETITRAKRDAYRYVASGSWWREHKTRFPCSMRTAYDMRTLYGKTKRDEVARLTKIREMIEMSQKAFVKRWERRERKDNTDPLVLYNSLHSPLYLDWKKHDKGNCRVYDDHLCFDRYRNHWAKNTRDMKVLAILKRNQHNYIR